MKESNIQREIMLASSALGSATLFRNNVGLGWTGRTISVGESGRVVLADARPVKFGLCKGSGDLIGWRTVTITPEMVGRTVAVFASLEVKTKTGRVSPEQANFRAAVERAGGIAAVVRSDAEAVAALTGGIGRE